MGFKDWVADAPVATFGNLTLRKDRVQKLDGFKKEEHPLDGVMARVESGAELDSRITATRLVSLGIFALAFKKKSGGEGYLTIEGPDFLWFVEVDRKKKGDAIKFAMKLNNHVKESAAEAREA